MVGALINFFDHYSLDVGLWELFFFPGKHINDKIYIKGQLFMHYQFPGFTIAYAVSAVLCSISAGMAWKRRINSGSIPFTLLMLSLTIWSFASIFEAGVLTAKGKILWSQWQFLGATTVTPLWLFFAAGYTDKSEFLKKKTRWLIWIPPIATLMLAFTNELHHLIWMSVTVMADVLNIGYYVHGIGFYVFIAYSYAYLLIGTIWLVKGFLTGQKRHRLQTIFFIIAIIISWAANILYVLQLIPIPGFDITPLSFSVIALIMSWGILRNQFFDLVPIVRDTLLGSMVEGVIVIDLKDIILEINPAALDILSYDGPQPVGQSIQKIFCKYGEVIEQFKVKNDLQAEVEILGDPPRTIDLHITSINEEENTFGQLIVLRDITKK